MKIMKEEFEVFEGRYKATKNEVTNICDNFIERRDFDGITFLKLIKAWENGKRIYYGTRREDNPLLTNTRLLGYVEITELKRWSKDSVRVRIVCIWRPLLAYWEELPGRLEYFFEVIPKDERVRKKQEDISKDLVTNMPEIKANYEEVPYWFPKLEKTKAKWKKMYKIIKRTRKEYLKEYKKQETRNPIPTSDDLRDAIFKEMKLKYSAKTISNIQKAGDKGLLVD
jgi:hypothetical protein